MSLFNVSDKYRCVCFTLNNYTREQEELFTTWNGYSYLVYGREIGESGTPHLQGYMELKRQSRGSVLVKRFPGVHFERRLSPDNQSCIDYCKKGEQSHEEWDDLSTFGPNYGKGALVVELGTPRANGVHVKTVEDFRSDLLSGQITPEQIAIEHPQLYCRFYKAICTTYDEGRRSVRRNWETNCEWHFGKTGVGKTRYLYDKFAEQIEAGEVYFFNPDHGWFDSYKGQSICIFDDIREEDIPYNQVLKLTDRYHYEVARRGRCMQPWLARECYFTSSRPPWEVYTFQNATGDSISQLLRRVKVFERLDENTITESVYNPRRSISSSSVEANLFVKHSLKRDPDQFD